MATIATRNMVLISAVPPALLIASTIATTKTADAAPAAQIGTITVPVAASTPGMSWSLVHYTPRTRTHHRQIFAIMPQPGIDGYRQSSLCHFGAPRRSMPRLVVAREFASLRPSLARNGQNPHERSIFRHAATFRRPDRSRRNRRSRRRQPHSRRPGRARRLRPCEPAPSWRRKSLFSVALQVARHHHGGGHHGVRPRFQSGRSAGPAHVHRALHPWPNPKAPS